jgi:hypothetical protein
LWPGCPGDCGTALQDFCSRNSGFAGAWLWRTGFFVDVGERTAPKNNPAEFAAVEPRICALPVWRSSTYVITFVTHLRAFTNRLCS